MKKEPWRLGTLAVTLVGLALLLVGAMLAIDTVLVMHQFEGGLPEALTTSIFGLANVVIGYAGACLQARSKAGDDGSDG